MGAESIGAGDRFTGPERPQNPGLMAFLDIISRNREPAEIAPIGPTHYRGSTAPVQQFGFGDRGGQVNDPAVIKASSRAVPLALRHTHRGPKGGR